MNQVTTRPSNSSTRAAVAVTLAAILWLAALLAPVPARADGDPSRDIVRAVDVAITVNADGTLHVEETYHWDFGTRNGLGFYRDLITAQGYGPEPDKVRLYEYSNYTISSPSGAPANVWVESNRDGMMRLAIGAPDGSSDTRTGLQTYVLSYDAAGLLNAVRGDAAVGDRDELYTNIFQDNGNPMERVTVTVTGPTDVIDVACYQGPFGSTDRCTSYASTGPTATLIATGLRAGEGFTVSVAWPAGTFADIAPILADRDKYGGVAGEPGAVALALGRANTAVAGNWGWLLLAWLAALGYKGWRRVEAGRDLYFVGLPPGLLPAGMTLTSEDGATPDPGGTAVAKLRREPPVTVQFTPPATLTPAEAGTLEAEWTKSSFFAATLVDLAVRGHLTFETAKRGPKGEPTDWRLRRVKHSDTHGLKGFERGVLGKVFGPNSTVLLSSLDEKFAARMAAFRTELDQLSDARRFFQRPGLLGGDRATPKTRRSCLPGILWMVGGVLLVGLFIVQGTGFAPVGAMSKALLIALVTYPLVTLATRKAAHGRSAHGRALYEQVRGFRQYLTTADANQIRWEEGQDIFSRYLPWAMVFGITERWAAIFAELAARGVYTQTPDWYLGAENPGPRFYSDLGRSVSDFSQHTTTSLVSTPGSSGGSGSFSSSGGGGFSGGGGGGGGGAGGR